MNDFKNLGRSTKLSVLRAQRKARGAMRKLLCTWHLVFGTKN